MEERRAVIVQNKGKGCGRGKQRQVHVIEKAECLDSMKLSAEKPFLTKKQFLTHTNWFWQQVEKMFSFFI